MVSHHSDRPSKIDERLSNLEREVKTLDSRIEKLEMGEKTGALFSEVKKMQTEGIGAIGYDKAKKEFNELMTKAIGEVTFLGNLSGKDYLEGNREMKCDYCASNVKKLGCRPYAERRKDEIVFGKYCAGSNIFYAIQGKLPIPKMIRIFLDD